MFFSYFCHSNVLKCDTYVSPSINKNIYILIPSTRVIIESIKVLYLVLYHFFINAACNPFLLNVTDSA